MKPLIDIYRQLTLNSFSENRLIFMAGEEAAEPEPVKVEAIPVGADAEAAPVEPLTTEQIDAKKDTAIQRIKEFQIEEGETDTGVEAALRAQLTTETGKKFKELQDAYITALNNTDTDLKDANQAFRTGVTEFMTTINTEITNAGGIATPEAEPTTEESLRTAISGLKIKGLDVTDPQVVDAVIDSLDDKQIAALDKGKTIELTEENVQQAIDGLPKVEAYAEAEGTTLTALAKDTPFADLLAADQPLTKYLSRTYTITTQSDGKTIFRRGENVKRTVAANTKLTKADLQELLPPKYTLLLDAVDTASNADNTGSLNKIATLAKTDVASLDKLGPALKGLNATLAKEVEEAKKSPEGLMGMIGPLFQLITMLMAAWKGKDFDTIMEAIDDIQELGVKEAANIMKKSKDYYANALKSKPDVTLSDLLSAYKDPSKGNEAADRLFGDKDKPESFKYRKLNVPAAIKAHIGKALGGVTITSITASEINYTDVSGSKFLIQLKSEGGKLQALVLPYEKNASGATVVDLSKATTRAFQTVTGNKLSGLADIVNKPPEATTASAEGGE